MNQQSRTESKLTGPSRSRFATRLAAWMPLVGAGLLLAPVDNAESAVVLIEIAQGGNGINTTSLVGFTFTNDDIGATYNSATLDLAAVIGPVVDSIIANNPAYNTAAEVYGAISFNITPTGNVSTGWSASINPATGMMSLNHGGGTPNANYTVWSHSRIMTGTLNLSNLLDFNSNGLIDPNETLAFDGLAENAFVAQEGVFFYQADVPRVTVIPEPSGLALPGVGLLVLLRRKRRKGSAGVPPAS